MNIPWEEIDSFVGNHTNPALTYYRPCPVCGRTAARTIQQFSDFQFYSDNAILPKRTNVTEVQCLDCFCMYLNPCYSTYGFEVLFAEAGQSYGATDGRPEEQIHWLTERGLLDAGKSILDAGCFDGRFLAQMPKDVKRVGVDIDAPALQRGKNNYGEDGVEFILGDFESFRCDYPLDAITMFHVLEHLPRPVAVLRNLREISHETTNLIIEVPIIQNAPSNDINGFFSVQHMTHFSRASLKNMFSLSGWHIEEWCEQPDYNGCRVRAVPAHPLQAVTGDPGDVEEMHRCAAEWHVAVQKANQRLRPLEDAQHVVIYGGGAHTEFIYQVTSIFRSDSKRKYVIVDGDPLKHGTTWRGIGIHEPVLLEKVDWTSSRLLISSYGSQDSMVNSVEKLGVPTDAISKLYDSLRVY